MGTLHQEQESETIEKIVEYLQRIYGTEPRIPVAFPDEIGEDDAEFLSRNETIAKVRTAAILRLDIPDGLHTELLQIVGDIKDESSEFERLVEEAFKRYLDRLPLAE